MIKTRLLGGVAALACVLTTLAGFASPASAALVESPVVV
jgi:hypothetical protein